MSVRAADFLECAQAIASRGDEIGSRAAVSRAYYAAYHDSVDWESKLPHLGTVRRPGGMHHELFERLTNAHVALPREAKLRSTKRGILLRKLHGDRVRADYTLDQDVDVVEGAQAVADAQVIFTIK